MIKLYRFLTRRLDMTHDDAVRYWTEQHAPRVVDALGDRLSRYAVNVCLPNRLDDEEPPEAPPWDGIDEMWLDVEAEDIKETFAGPAAALASSERAFLGTSQWMLVEEIVQRDDANRPYEFKILEPLLRRRDQTWKEFIDFWLNEHVPLVKRTYGDAVVRYSTNLGLSNPFNWRMPEEGPPYDGVAEFHLAWTLDEYKRAMDDHAEVLVPDEILLLSSWRLAFVREVVMKGSR